MRDNDVIAELARQNLSLQEEKKAYLETLRSIKSKLISIGAPLNDNYYKYNKKQLQIFFDILGEVNTVLPTTEE